MKKKEGEKKEEEEESFSCAHYHHTNTEKSNYSRVCWGAADTHLKLPSSLTQSEKQQKSRQTKERGCFVFCLLNIRDSEMKLEFWIYLCRSFIVWNLLKFTIVLVLKTSTDSIISCLILMTTRFVGGFICSLIWCFFLL